VAALNAGTPEAAKLADLYARPEPSEDDLAETAALVEAAGGRAWAELEAESRIQLAAEALLAARVPDSVRAEFLRIADFVTRRDH
jgi:geranylgeranyl diphosphate synthase type I